MQKQTGYENTSVFEEWKDAPGFEGRYLVSSTGRVARLLKPKIRTNGRSAHARVDLSLGDGSKSRQCWVHRLVLGAFVGPCPGVDAEQIISARNFQSIK